MKMMKLTKKKTTKVVKYLPFNVDDFKRRVINYNDAELIRNVSYNDNKIKEKVKKVDEFISDYHNLLAQVYSKW